VKLESIVFSMRSKARFSFALCHMGIVALRAS
jgi:hypothetical protein